jgi:oxalate decarboxylase/phosphoglucose isomerase-like protein (cupin superfamily)
VTITDQDAVYAFFKTNPKVRELLQSLAEAAVKQSIEVPGAAVTKEQQSRIGGPHERHCHHAANRREPTPVERFKPKCCRLIAR